MRYPAFLDLTGEKVVVVGAGRVATRKIRSLIAAGASITAIGPEATPHLQKLEQQGRIRWKRRRYRAGDLHGARLVVAATNSLDLNRRVCAEARLSKLLINCVSSPVDGNFIVPSVVRRGLLTIAISTGGASPALARQVRHDLEEFITDGYLEAAKKMLAVRKTTLRNIKPTQVRQSMNRRALRQRVRTHQ